jgi:hypothetical protein
MSQVGRKIGFTLQKFTLGANFSGTPQCRHFGKSTVNGSEDFFPNSGEYCLPALSRARQWRIRKCHSTDMRENLRGEEHSGFGSLFILPFIYPPTNPKHEDILPLSIHPSTIHPST